MSRYISPELGKIEEYVPGEQPQDKQYIKLNTNESPYPPSENVVKAINSEKVADLRLYSDPNSSVLINKLSEYYKVEPENVFVGNGSDEVLNFAFMAYGKSGALFPDITYGFYPVFGDLYNINYEEIPLKEDFSINPQDYIGKNKLIVIANPNAPTGLVMKTEDIINIIESNPNNVVIIDEAYVDFGAESVIPLTKKYQNLLVVSTFSKSRSLAGARVGFGIADKEIIRDLNRIKNTTNPYNINRLSMFAAAAAIDSQSYFDGNAAQIIKTREKTKKALEELGFTVTESKANFLFAKSDKIDGESLYKSLKAKGVLVRHFGKTRIKDYLRITIGTPEQMEILIEKIKEII